MNHISMLRGILCFVSCAKVTWKVEVVIQSSAHWPPCLMGLAMLVVCLEATEVSVQREMRCFRAFVCGHFDEVLPV